MNRQSKQPDYKKQKGAALVTTLFVLVLITVIVVAFLGMVNVAQQSSKYHKDTVELQNLKDSALSIALAQIRDGTTRDGEIWASQPGAIRTFIEDSGEPAMVYKLYSDDEMTVEVSNLTTPVEKNLVTDVPTNWMDSETVYVDLNRPVVSLSDNDLHFPILDPRIFDGTEATPEGFSYEALHASGGASVNGVMGPTDARHPNDQRVPMPVRWIYILRDGSMGTMNESGFVPFANANDASAANPMVGRFAFWCDDESCKLNLNTASEAIPWDTPRCATPEDVEFAKHPPVRNEVQRFSGHPAATCLSSVFYPNQDLDPDRDQAKFQAIYDLVPRVNSGGYLNNRSTNPVQFDTDRLYSNIDEALLKPDREETNDLFADVNIDRLSRSRFLLTANSRAPEVTAAGTPRVCLWPVHWMHDSVHQTAFDSLISFNGILNERPYLFLRNGANTNIGEYRVTGWDGTVTGEVNAELLQYIMDYSARRNQGYALTLQEKYSAHDMNTLGICFTEFMRQTNLHDNTIAPSGERVVPYAGAFGDRAWGTELHGQVTNINLNHLPSWTRERLSQDELRTNGIGRIYAASEVGFAFLLAAQQPRGASDGNPEITGFNTRLADKLQLLPGQKAIQVAPIFEGFNPGQGYTMSAPASAARFHPTDLGRLQLQTSAGIVELTNAEYTAEFIQQYNVNNNKFIQLGGSPRSDKGGLAHAVSYLRGKAFGEPDSDALHSPAEWWVGWGGSGGRWMYAGSNANRSSHMSGERLALPDTAMALNPQISDSFDHRLPNQYSRGYFVIPPEDTTVTLSKQGGNSLRFMLGNQRNADFAGHNTYITIPSNTEIPVPDVPVDPRFVAFPTWGERHFIARGDMRNAGDRNSFTYENPELLDENDVVRTWVSRHGDHRLQYIRETEKAALSEDKRLFVPHPGWDPDGSATDGGEMQVHSFTFPGGESEPGATFESSIVPDADYPTTIRPDFTIAASNPAFSANLPSGYAYSVDPAETRDWDNGTGIAPDGPYWNKVDDVAHAWQDELPPYFSKRWDGSTPDSINETSAPNQQIPSAAIFGSLNSAPATGIQWTTLLFRPDITDGGHLGSKDRTLTGDRTGAPPDHTILDLFWMPVVQPYALSERFSTAGKINMNYRIAPFSYINRSTGLHGVLKSERMLAIPTNAGQTYKDYSSASSNQGWRHRIDSTETLKQFEQKFNNGDVFRTESEICEQFLVPRGEQITSMESFWDNHRLTGDNTLERPYANIYPRLTTRSNIYRVHLITQTIRKSRGSDPTIFDTELDSAASEYRGEALVERAIDPNDSEIPDYVENPDSARLDNFYRYRILYTRKFAP